MRVYDTLLKDKDLVDAELRQLEDALDRTIKDAIQWLVARFEPAGPIMAEPNVSFVYKTLWGLHTVGRSDYANRLLDWITINAVQSNSDIYFASEHPAERDGTRGYRMMTILRCAAESGHPLAADPSIRTRALQYFDERSGGAYTFLGDDPTSPVFPNDHNVGDTVFFGEYSLGMHDRARTLRVADWLVNVIDQNESHLSGGKFYWHTDREGTLDVEISTGMAIDRVVDRSVPNQLGWVIGCAMAFLADTYGACRDRWSMSHADASRYLEHALMLLEFEDEMPLEAYFFPCKCKVAWGAGRLLSMLTKYDVGGLEDLDRAYRAGRRTYIYTFLGNQRPDGSWGEIFYPTDSRGREIAFDYRVMNGCWAIPDARECDSETSVPLNDIEITGEFLAEIAFLRRGIHDLHGTFDKKNATIGEPAVSESR